jgi:hypothetical protein
MRTRDIEKAYVEDAEFEQGVARIEPVYPNIARTLKALYSRSPRESVARAQALEGVRETLIAVEAEEAVRA